VGGARRAAVRVAVVVGAVAGGMASAGCDDTVPQWQLDNDRIIAVRATPPHIPAGTTATIDALVTKMGVGPSVEAPSGAIAAPMRADQPVPPEMAAAVAFAGGQWTVTAPSEDVLVQLRTELGLMPGEPVPMLIGVQLDFASGPLLATKLVSLGDSGDNPELGDVTVGGMPAHDGMTVPPDTDIALHATAADTDRVDWLTSVGDLSDDDDPDATLNHDTQADPPQPTSGQLAVVKRDEMLGVTWAFWTLTIQ
jgi:hypothetical protein